MTRKPSASGIFYSSNKEKLKEEIGIFPSKKNIKAVISPHAGYMFSGKISRNVLGKFEDKKDFIILGVNHSGIGNKISISKENFETPFGLIKNNQTLTNKILKKLQKENLDAEINEIPHLKEHSIEIQLPFLQLSQKSFSIIPILLKDLNYEECKKIAGIISNFIDDNIALIISSDFTHYGKNYNFIPFTTDIRKNLYKLDNSIIIEILNLNSKKFYEKAAQSTICGLFGITIAIEIAKIKNWKAKLTEYFTSGDIVDDFENCVGYAGITFN